MNAASARLAGRHVLLTGATGGLGQAIARAFAARGTNLFLTGRRTDILEDLARELGARALECELSDPEHAEQLVAAAGRVDVLVANAALPATGSLLEYTPEQIDRALAVNLRAPIMLAHAVLPAMVQRGSGHLVFIASTSGKAAAPQCSLYAATKFGIRGFALCLRQDLRGTGVGVSIVSPGFISDAGMFAKTGATLPPGVGTKTPQDVAAAVIRAIARNRAEIDVAPAVLRVGVALAGLAPEASATVSRLMGSETTAERIMESQRGQR